MAEKKRTRSQEDMIKEAAIRNHNRKQKVAARIEVMPHLGEVYQAIEKSRAVVDVTAEKYGISRDELWKWSLEQLS